MSKILRHTLYFLLIIGISNLGLAQTITPVNVSATVESPPFYVTNLFDGAHNTRWGAEGVSVYATFDLGTAQNFDQFRIVYLNSDIRKAFFDIDVSDDGVTWTTIAPNMESNGTTQVSHFEDFDFPNQFARYVRYHGKGNTINNWNSLYELQIVNASTIGDVNGSADTQLPIPPTLSSTGHTEITVNLSWSGATDNIGVTGYNVYQDGSLVTTLGNMENYQVSGLTASTSYGFNVRALDAQGNESANSNTVNVTTDSTSGGGSPPTGDSPWSKTGTTVSVADGNDNVAIGTASVPTGYKMAVDGNVLAEEIRVELSGSWPDYVFEKEYDLPSLEEIQKHIQEKGHLPNIPSALEVGSNGIEVGEMNRLLLEKIEEQMLYILQLEKRISVLEN